MRRRNSVHDEVFLEFITAVHKAFVVEVRAHIQVRRRRKG